MEELRGRIIIIPSNTPSNTSAKNTSNFKINLEKPLEINSDLWEIALLEINYPHSWGDEIPASECIYQTGSLSDYAWRLSSYKDYKDVDSHKQEDLYKIKWNSCSGPSEKTYYESIQNLIDALNLWKPKNFKGKFVLVTKGSNKNNPPRVQIYLKKYDVIFMKEFLSQILGFQSNILYDTDGVLMNEDFIITATNLPDPRISIYNMFVYCNLVEESFVGNNMVKLLRTVPLNPKEHGEYVTRVFHPLRYLRLSSSFFQNIEIFLTDDIGNPIRFKWGKVIVHLHLRPRKYSSISNGETKNY